MNSAVNGTPASRELIRATDTDLLRCAEEPILTPGSIQPHGVLITARLASQSVTHVSANAEALLNIPATELIGATLGEVLGEAVSVPLFGVIAADDYRPGRVVTLIMALGDGAERCFHVHGYGPFLVVEIELAAAGRNSENAFGTSQAILAKLRNTRSLDELAARVAAEFHILSGYDRVMVYRFDAEGHGQVIAEARNPDTESYLDLRYPASDIPEQARRLYILTRVRVIPDFSYAPVPLLAANGIAALDMSHCMLRSVSPIHVEYIQNMGVAATLCISIVQDQRLWGMIVCHHSAPLFPPQNVRQVCEVIGELFGLLLFEAEERDRLARLVAIAECLAVISYHLDRGPPILQCLTEVKDDLLKLVGADGAFIRFAGKTCSIGDGPDSLTAGLLLDTLHTENTDEIVAINELGLRYPSLKHCVKVASGVLVLPFANHTGDGILWFRKEVIETVTWGGDPGVKAHVEPDTGRISPRKSFAAWKEIVEGHSRPWSDEDQRAAGRLRRVLTRALLRQAETELFRISNSDPLTGLANRNVLDEYINRWRSANAAQPAALMFFDLDRFKTVNDSLGHYAGDELLRDASKRLTKIVTAPKLLVRMGGDEFVVFCPGVSEAEAWNMAQSVLHVFDEPFAVAGRPYQASASIGLAYSPQASDVLLREADAAMYAAKRQGGNRAVRFHTKLHEAVRDRMRTEQDLFVALERGEMEVYFQPIVALPDARLRGFEALARWRHPELGWIPPDKFIPLSEDIGLINTLGKWVASQAITALSQLDDKTLVMTINVSGNQLMTGKFCDDLKALLLQNSLAPQRISIEITESALASEEAVAELWRIRELGCRIAVDDFGTGYSSLAYLRRLPVDVIKIDRSFVATLGYDPDTEKFLDALVSLVHTLRLRVVAEGVETEAQWRLLSAMSCDAAQGYYFGRPAPDCNFHFVPNTLAVPAIQ